MTEKGYCGQCDYLIRNEVKNRLPLLYCPIIKREVSFIGYTCPKFKERIITDETDLELVEMQRKIFE